MFNLYRQHYDISAPRDKGTIGAPQLALESAGSDCATTMLRPRRLAS